MPDRIDKTNYYLNIAEAASQRSTCLKRQYGSIIVKNDSIISTGFNGSSRGVTSCLETGKCLRQNSARGTDYSNCISVHSEQNAIIHASRNDMLGSDLYLVGTQTIDGVKTYVENVAPCSLCKRMIINAGIKSVIVRITDTEFKVFNIEDWKNNRDSLIGGY